VQPYHPDQIFAGAQSAMAANQTALGCLDIMTLNDITSPKNKEASPYIAYCTQILQGTSKTPPNPFAKSTEKTLKTSYWYGLSPKPQLITDKHKSLSNNKFYKTILLKMLKSEKFTAAETRKIQKDINESNINVDANKAFITALMIFSTDFSIHNTDILKELYPKKTPQSHGYASLLKHFKSDDPVMADFFKKYGKERDLTLLSDYVMKLEGGSRILENDLSSSSKEENVGLPNVGMSIVGSYALLSNNPATSVETGLLTFVINRLEKNGYEQDAKQLAVESLLAIALNLGE
jgi:hypothetical protein